MSEAQEIRNRTFETLKSFGLGEAEAAIIVCAANSNHPVPKDYLVDQAETFLKEALRSESPLLRSKIINAISTLREAKILGEGNYYTPLECYHMCSLSHDELISKLSKMKGVKIPKETSTLFENLNALAKRKQEIGWMIQNRVGLSEKLRNFKPTKLFYDVKSKDGSFSFEESRKYLDDMDETTNKALRDAKPYGEIYVKTSAAGWLVRKMDIISENLANGASFSIIILPIPRGSGKQEWKENVKRLFDAFKGHKDKLKLKIWPADIANSNELMLQMTLVDQKHAIVSQRRLGDVKICAPCYSDDKGSINEAWTLFRSYRDKSLFWHLLKVAKLNVSLRAQMVFGAVAAVLGAVMGTQWSYFGLIIGAIIGVVGVIALSVPFTALGYFLEIKWPLFVLSFDP